MAIEKDPQGRSGGEPTSISVTTQVENSQPRLIQRHDKIPKNDLPLFQEAGIALTRAGLGAFSTAIAEEQRDPFTQKPIPEDSPDIAVTISSIGNYSRLFKLVERAASARQRAEREGKPQEAIDQAVQDAIWTGTTSYQEQAAHRSIRK